MTAREIITENLGHSDFDDNTPVGELADSLTLLSICYDLEDHLGLEDLMGIRGSLPADATLGQFLAKAGLTRR